MERTIIFATAAVLAIALAISTRFLFASLSLLGVWGVSVYFLVSVVLARREAAEREWKHIRENQEAEREKAEKAAHEARLKAAYEKEIREAREAEVKELRKKITRYREREKHIPSEGTVGTREGTGYASGPSWQDPDDIYRASFKHG